MTASKGLAPERSIDAGTRIKAWTSTAAMVLLCLVGVHAIAPTYTPGRKLLPGIETQAPPPRAKPVILKQGFETMIVSSTDDGTVGGAETVDDSDGKPTTQTQWVEPVPPSVEVNRLEHGSIAPETTDPGRDLSLDVPRSCAAAAHRMIGHGVSVPTTWWRVPANDPTSIADELQTTHKPGGLVHAICEDGPDPALDAQAGIPTAEAAGAAQGAKD